MSIITTRKRSLGQGNVFTGVCLSTGVCGENGGVNGERGCGEKGWGVVKGDVWRRGMVGERGWC